MSERTAIESRPTDCTRRDASGRGFEVSSVKRFLPALLIFAFNLAAAPFLGRLRDALLERFEGGFVRLLALVLGALLAALIVAALLSIRTHRARRYGLLGFAVALVALDVASGSGVARVDVVEKVHFLQYGALAAALYWALRPRGDLSVPLLALLGTLAAGTLEELLHWWLPARVGELGDVWLNLYAGLFGLAVAAALLPPEDWTPRLAPGAGRTLARWALPVLLLVAGFYHAAHVGHEIVDREVGFFVSWHTAEELEAISARRAAAPPERAAWRGEDRFDTEAGWHVAHRNASLEAGRARHAWIENRLLETYYDPFLDRTPSSGESATHRWSAEQRAAVALAAGDVGPAPGYVSPVLRGRVRPRPTAIELWLGVALAASALAWLGFSPRAEPRRA